MKFQSDLKFGQIYEKEFIKIMGFQTYKHETSKAIKEYDIIVKYNAQTSIEFETKYEIKADRLSYKTGNVCIEIANCGRPSGITSTKSDYWGYFVIKPDGYDLYLIPTEELKQMVNPKNYKVIRGGDGKKSELILIPISHLEKFKYISQHKEYL
jgi:hypothetical protein